ncbi:DUF3000 domain-containing protein [Actinospica durhamensis]|uniref:DUF3000 domain-containing protein n=1 Tax=Actinospica durhamensis TaxID=1508375 RepID=A0A941IVD0_9ACTN|nr:DUF3000 domain-containing protein [Actinospica durhamensis]MBR7839098.1 DUF3000 domain-containing protein [Actinospica durhamensis]
MNRHPHPPGARRAATSSAPGSADGAVPEVFAAAVGGIAALRPRPGMEFEPLPAPRRLASYSHALSATVTGPAADGEEEELGSGRFVLLYEPDGHEEWQGSWRCVTLLQAEIEVEIAQDPLLPEVTWSWLSEALAELGCAALGGTVSRCASAGFGELEDQGVSTSVELRASWSPLPPEPEAGARWGTRPLWTPATAWSGLAAHVEAWSRCLATAVGLPPELAGVARLPRVGG